jgi:hypothetical protein
MSDTTKTFALTDSRTIRLFTQLNHIIIANKSGAAYENAFDAFECHLRVKYGATEQECNSIYFDLIEKELK